MTNQQWKNLEFAAKHHLFFKAKFKIDGYDVTITKEFISDTKMAYLVAVNGTFVIRSKNEDCAEIQRRFHRAKVKKLTSEKFRKIILSGIRGKKAIAEAVARFNLDATITNYFFWFDSIAQIKKTWEANNESISDYTLY
jgi:hypothetical protein